VTGVDAAVEGSTRIGDASLHWRREGHGRPIVFLHGFPLSGRTWDGVVSELRARFACHAPDLVGLGQSHSRCDLDHSSPGQARALQALLRERGVESYALVGNDTGGWVARELALIEGERVSHLVLTNTEIPRHRPPWIPTHQALARVPGCGRVMRWLLGFAAFRRSPLAFGGCFEDLQRLDGAFHDHFVQPLIDSPARMEGALRFLRCMKFARLDELESLHRDLTMPTLFVWGADDPTFPEPRAREMSRQFPNLAGFHAIAGSKLFVHEEHPREVAAQIESFLSA
jgi:pimeloyl-ACP methyl ester carboxylesterase